MKFYTNTIQVELDDLDDLKHVNNVRYVQWIQDIAKAHWYEVAGEELIESYFWVVLSHHIQYKSSAVLHDFINIKTYVTTAEGVTSTRVVEMYNSESGKLIVKAETAWCLMDSKSRKPVRIPEKIRSLFL